MFLEEALTWRCQNVEKTHSEMLGWKMRQHLCQCQRYPSDSNVTLVTGHSVWYSNVWEDASFTEREEDSCLVWQRRSSDILN